mgnify:CR=1 FL=1
MSQFQVESFESIPSVTRFGAGVRQPSETLLAIRQLQPKQKITFTADPKEDFAKFAHKINGKTYGKNKGALGFKPVIRVDKKNRTVTVFRTENGEKTSN